MWILATVQFAATVAASDARQPEIADLLCEVVLTVQRILLVGRMAKYLAVLVQPYVLRRLHMALPRHFFWSLYDSQRLHIAGPAIPGI